MPLPVQPRQPLEQCSALRRERCVLGLCRPLVGIRQLRAAQQNEARARVLEQPFADGHAHVAESTSHHDHGTLGQFQRPGD